MINEDVMREIRAQTHSETEQAEAEFRRILADRETLRNEVFKTSIDDSIHMPVNVARLIWNAKSQFGIRPISKSDLRPSTVTQKLDLLLSELSVMPGSTKPGNMVLAEADLNARRLFNIYIRH